MCLSGSRDRFISAETVTVSPDSFNFFKYSFPKFWDVVPCDRHVLIVSDYLQVPTAHHL